MSTRAPRGSHAVEVEWQLAAPDLAAFRRWLVDATFAGWAVVPLGVLRLSDVYFDTTDWRIWRAGYALRVRRTDGELEATLKALKGRRRGPARRLEITDTPTAADARAVLAIRGEFGVLLGKILGGERPRRLFGVRTRRDVFAVRDIRRAVRHDGGPAAELTLDRTRVASRGRERRLERIEVEVKAGPTARVARFVATLRRRRHLTAATRSKFQEGLAAARLRPPPRR